MHAPRGQVVEIIVRERHAADEHRDDAAHVQQLCGDVAENAEEVGDDHLRYLAAHQETHVLEDQRTDQR